VSKHLQGVQIQGSRRLSTKPEKFIIFGLDEPNDVHRGAKRGFVMRHHLYPPATRRWREATPYDLQVDAGMVNPNERQGDFGPGDQLLPDEVEYRLAAAKLPHQRVEPLRCFIQRKQCAVHQCQGRAATLDELLDLADAVLECGQYMAPGPVRPEGRGALRAAIGKGVQPVRDALLFSTRVDSNPCTHACRASQHKRRTNTRLGGSVIAYTAAARWSSLSPRGEIPPARLPSPPSTSV